MPVFVLLTDAEGHPVLRDSGGVMCPVYKNTSQNNAEVVVNVDDLYEAGATSRTEAQDRRLATEGAQALMEGNQPTTEQRRGLDKYWKGPDLGTYHADSAELAGLRTNPPKPGKEKLGKDELAALVAEGSKVALADRDRNILALTESVDKEKLAGSSWQARFEKAFMTQASETAFKSVGLDPNAYEHAHRWVQARDGKAGWHVVIDETTEEPSLVKRSADGLATKGADPMQNLKLNEDLTAYVRTDAGRRLMPPAKGTEHLLVPGDGGDGSVNQALRPEDRMFADAPAG